MTDSKLTSIEIGRAALKIAVTGSRSEGAEDQAGTG